MNLKQLEYFVRVAELGSFSKAALILNVAQPALSRQVRLLETDLRAALLTRTGRGVVLTEAGKRLFDHSVGILQLVSQVRSNIDAAREEPAGRIVVGLPPSMGRLLTLPLVEHFSKALPKAQLAVVEGFSAHLAEWIATGRVDVGLLYNPEPQPALEVTPVLDEPLGLVSGRRRARKRAAGTIPFMGLAGLPLILPERSHFIRRMLETQAALIGCKLQVAFEISSVPSILELVAAGHGHAVLTKTALAACPQPSEFLLQLITEPEVIGKLCLVVSAQKPATPLARHVQRILREQVIETDARLADAHNKAR